MRERCGGKNPPQEINGDVLYVTPQPSAVTPEPGQHVFVAEHAVAPAERRAVDAEHVLAKLPEMREHDLAGFLGQKYCRPFKAGLRIRAGCPLGMLAMQEQEFRNPRVPAVQTQLGQHHAV